MISDENLEGYDRAGEIYYNPNVPLGTGAAGTVVCRGYFHKRYVAVKKYQRTLMSQMDNQMVKLLQADYHPNIVQYLGYAYKHDFCYLALQLCQANLKQYVDDSYKNESLELLSILKDILSGLSHLHNLSPAICHRDVKPTNCLIFAPNPTVKPIGVLSDLGLSKQLSGSNETLTMSQAVGTNGYMAPELLDLDEEDNNTSSKVTIKIDIFSTGCLLYYALTKGHNPFGNNPHLRNGNIVKNEFDLSKLEGNDKNFKSLIGKMISKEPDERPNADFVFESLCSPGILYSLSNDSESTALQIDNEDDNGFGQIEKQQREIDNGTAPDEGT